MASFIITSPAFAAHIRKRLVETQVNAGYRRGFEREVRGWAVTSFYPLVDAPPHFVERSDGTFLVAAGHVIYRGGHGAPALSKLLDDFLSDDVDRDRLFGNYAIVVGTPERLTVFNDPLNGMKIYRNAAETAFSTMFLSTFAAESDVEIDIQGLYEFAWLGVPNGTRTMFKNVASLPSNTMTTLAGERTERRATSSPDWLSPDMSRYAMDELVLHCGSRIAEAMGALTSQFGKRINTALSGGFDSRLILAALLHCGATPQLFTYGRPKDKDRRVAEKTARSLGLELQSIDKSLTPVISERDYVRHIEQNIVAFDGWLPTGIFDNGSDRQDRIKRLRGVSAIVNGSGGECLRNFFYLPDRPFKVDDIVSTFYSTYKPAAATAAFDEGAFRRTLREQIAFELGVEPEATLGRHQVELAYPLFRVRYWSARDMAANQRFGWAYYPYLQPRLVCGTPTIPLRFKTHGRLEARIIRALGPKLAAQYSDYGFRFDRPVPLAYRAKMLATYSRPLWLRRRSYRLQNLLPRGRPYFLKQRYLSHFVDPDLPIMRQYFKPGKIHDQDAFNRVATVEYLLNWHKAQNS